MKTVMHIWCFVILGGYAVLALYLLSHGAYAYWSAVFRTDKAERLPEEPGFKEQRNEPKVFIFRRLPIDV